MEYAVNKLLMEREKRVILQNELIIKYKLPLMTVRVNYPGIQKDNDITEGIIEILDKLLSSIFMLDIYYKIFKITEEGPMLIILIKKEPLYIKKTSIEIEDKHILGRCVDIDVYDLNCKSISRVELGHARRKCYICDDFAQNCVRSRKHKEYEVKRFIKNCYKQYRETFYGKRI